MNEIYCPLVIAGAVVFVYSILIWIFGGEKYFKWYCRHRYDPSECDMKLFKLIHVAIMIMVSCFFIAVGLFVDTSKPTGRYVFLFFSIPIIQDILLLTVCKKKTTKMNLRQKSVVVIASFAVVGIILWFFLPGWDRGKILGIVSMLLLIVSMALSYSAEEKQKKGKPQ